MFSNPFKNRLLPKAEPRLFSISNPPQPATLKRKLPALRISTVYKKSKIVATADDSQTSNNVTTQNDIIGDTKLGWFLIT